MISGADDEVAADRHSGPVVAGVIGRKRFLYDLWGDSVNTASPMESHGTPGQIQITRATYELSTDDFVCRRRGTIVVKSKGRMETWYLVASRSETERAQGAMCAHDHEPMIAGRHGVGERPAE